MVKRTDVLLFGSAGKGTPLPREKILIRRGTICMYEGGINASAPHPERLPLRYHASEKFYPYEGVGCVGCRLRQLAQTIAAPVGAARNASRYAMNPGSPAQGAENSRSRAVRSTPSLDSTRSLSSFFFGTFSCLHRPLRGALGLSFSRRTGREFELAAILDLAGATVCRDERACGAEKTTRRVLAGTHVGIRVELECGAV